MKLPLPILAGIAALLAGGVQSFPFQRSGLTSLVPNPLGTVEGFTPVDIDALKLRSDNSVVEVTHQHNISARRLQAISITAEQWPKYVNKGCSLVKVMLATDAEAADLLKIPGGSAESKYKKYDDLASWGYEHEEKGVEMFRNEGKIDVRHALRFYGLNTKKDGGENEHTDYEDEEEDKRGEVLNICRAVKHLKETTHNGMVYEVTHAFHRTIINADQGVLMGWYKFGPKHAVKNMNPPWMNGLFPDLQRWSDIAFLQWQAQCEERRADKGNLRYIFSVNVQNDETLSVLARALQADPLYTDPRKPSDYQFDVDMDCKRMLWPRRRTFTMQSERGKALLATPNGVGAAYLLATHKSTFGERTTIESVTVWCDQREWGGLQMLYLVKRDENKGDPMDVDPMDVDGKKADKEGS